MQINQPIRILHLVGDREDAGGVLSVLRNLDSVSDANTCEHLVWVNRAYRETRQPSLTYRFSDSVLAESSRHSDLLKQAFPASRELIQLCQEESFDIVHAHSRGTLLVAILYAWKTGRPVIYTNHNYARGPRLYRWAARRPKMYSVVLTQNMARHYGLDPKASRVRQISACYNDAYLSEPLIERRSSNGRRLKLIGVGSVIGWKKWDLVIEAIHRLDPEHQQAIEFDIWGPTLQFPEAIAFAERIKNMIRDYQLEETVHLRGSTTDVVSELRKSDLFVLPSTNEPCSVALMEALALGLPVVVSESGGNVDIVQSGCGLKFAPDNPNALAKVLTQVIENKVTFGQPGEIRDSVRHRCATNVLALYTELYQDIMAEHS